VANNASITVTVTGPNPATLGPVVVNTGTLASGATIDVDITSTYNMSTFGNYGFTASLVVNNDINTANNSKVKTVTSVGQTTVNAGSDVAICEGFSTNLNAVPASAWTTTNPSSLTTQINTTSLAIPDNDLVTGATSTITIPASLSVLPANSVINVNLSINHTYNSDLAIYLIAPNNSQITLANGNGGSGDNFNNVTFTMSAAANISTAPTNTITGSWIPQQAFSGLTGNAGGVWKLKMTDAFGGDEGTLLNWSITLPGPQGVTYTWTPSTGLSSTTIANPVANPTTTTNYSVQVTDERGCTASDNVLVTVNTNPVITKTTTDPTCVPGFDGIIDISVAGNPGFNYNWNTTATTQDLSGLSFGTYILTVTDTNSCISTDTTVFQVVGFNVTGNITNVSCFNGNDGAVDITVAGGTLPYSAYAWSNSATTEDINTLVDGSYSVTVTDAVGCTTTNSFTVTEPTALASSFAVTNVDCNSNATGIVDLTPAGGTTPYTYAWSNSATTQDINALVSGSYIVTITDDNNCILIDTAVVTQPNALATTIDTTNVSCFGFDDGEADLTVSGGTTPYSYAWTNSATTQDLTNLAPGNYTVIVTDANNCIISDSLLITEPDTLQTTVQATDVICYGENSGIGIVTPQGGTVPYDYLWSSGATDSLANFVAGNFTVVVTDANGCTSTNSITVDQPLLLTASIIESANVTCNDAADGSATVVAGFGTPTYTYAWSNGNTTPSVSSLDAGTYSVVVTDINGCTAMDEVVITEPTAIDASDIINNEVYGFDGAINITPSGGQLPYNYNWSNGATSQDINGLIAGTYTVTITDGNGCTESFTYTVMSTMNVDGAATEIGNIQFYPNPSDGIFNMNVAGFNGSSMNVEIMDMNGKVVNVSRIENASQNFTQSFDVRTLSEGTYFIRVTSETGSATSRMVIVK
jgi:subtilisin-like proprotein convertase family protein